MAFSRTASPARNTDDRQVAIKATMYFAYGRNARTEIRSKTTFQAILAGERTSTTRFPSWPGYERWQNAKAGDLVRFYEDRNMKGRFVDVTIDSVRDIDLSSCSDAELEAWSQAEGWSPAHGRQIGRQRGSGLQVRYHLDQ